MLISGVASDAPAPGIPTFVLQGRTDAMVTTPLVRAWATNAGARYAELDAGHFALLVRHVEAENAIRAWMISFTPRRA
jgi:pimeloyl-ACP methyl ester carboxylesterase